MHCHQRFPASMHRFFLGLALAGSLAACSTTSTTAQKSAPEDTPQVIAMGCMDAAVQWTLGEKPDDALMAKAKADAKAALVRVIQAGSAVTMEYNGARLNLSVNRQGLIERVSCG